MLINFLDTSAILNGGIHKFNDIYVSPLVLTELENIKNNANKTEYLQFLARQAIRDIIASDGIVSEIIKPAIIDKKLKKYSFLSNIIDHRLLCEAQYLAERENASVQFITSDSALFLFAQEMPFIKPVYLAQEITDNQQTVDYCGWSRHYPTDEQLALVYSDPKINSLKCKTNEFAEIFSNNELKDVKFWNGEQYTGLKYTNFRNMFNENIAPRNLEQKMLFHLLQNEDIKIKLCLGSFGTGKSYLMLQHALKGIRDGRFSKIVFVRNNIITRGSRDIGFLAGSLIEKIKPYLMPIADLTTPDYLDELIATETLVPVPLSFMRGRDFSGNIVVFVDEAENLTKENIQLLIGRIGEGSELWVAGDLKQIDHKEFEKNNGINRMINTLTGHPLFGMVKLIKSERSVTASMADLLD